MRTLGRNHTNGHKNDNEFVVPPKKTYSSSCFCSDCMFTYFKPETQDWLSAQKGAKTADDPRKTMKQEMKMKIYIISFDMIWG